MMEERQTNKEQERKEASLEIEKYIGYEEDDEEEDGNK